MAFHYRTICCSRACALVYFARVEEARGNKVENSQALEQAQSEIDSKSNDDIDSDLNQQMTEKPKRKYSKKKQLENESESSEQIEKSEGMPD